MSDAYSKRTLADGIAYLAVDERRFKTACLSITLTLPLERGKSGSRALIPYLLKSGCSKYENKTALQRELSRMYGAELVTDVARTGDMQQISLAITAIDDRYTMGGEHIFDRCAAMLCDVLLSPRVVDGGFAPDVFANERRMHIERIESVRNDKLMYAIKRLREYAGENEPSGTPLQGTTDELNAADEKSVYSAYLELLATAQIDIIAVGVMDHDAIAEMLAKAFAAAGRRFTPLPENIVKNTGTDRHYDETAAVVQANMASCWRIDESIPKAHARMMSLCLGGSEHSLLFENVREKLSLCYFCSSRYESEKNQMLIYSGLPAEKLDEADAAIRAEISKIAGGGLTARNIEAARLRAADACAKVYDSVYSIVLWYRSMVTRERTVTPEERRAEMLAVTPEQIAEAAKALSHDVTFIIRPEAN